MKYFLGDQFYDRFFGALKNTPTLIGVGTIHWFASPLPPNRTGGFPASGSPVGGFTSLRTGVISYGHPQD